MIYLYKSLIEIDFILFFRCSVDVTYLLFIDNINIIIVISIVGVRQRVEAILSSRSLK